MDNKETPPEYPDDVVAGQHRLFLVSGSYVDCLVACKARGVKMLQATRQPHRLPDLRKASQEEPYGEIPVPTYIGLQDGRQKPPRTPGGNDSLMPIVMVDSHTWIVKAMAS